jgi:hypothetical protein
LTHNHTFDIFGGGKSKFLSCNLEDIAAEACEAVYARIDGFLNDAD